MSETQTWKTLSISIIDDMRFAHQFSNTSWGKPIHRLALVDADDEVTNPAHSEPYDQPAMFCCKDVWYMAVTDFYEGAPDPNVVYKLVQAERNKGGTSA